MLFLSSCSGNVSAGFSTVTFFSIFCRVAIQERCHYQYCLILSSYFSRNSIYVTYITGNEHFTYLQYQNWHDISGIERGVPNSIFSIAMFEHCSSGNGTLSCNCSDILICSLDVISGIATFVHCISGNVITSCNNSGILISVLDFIIGIAILENCNTEIRSVNW